MTGEFHYQDCGEVGGGWPHPASAHDADEHAQVRERVAEALYRFACPNSTPGGWDLYKRLHLTGDRFYAQADAVLAALSGSSVGVQ